MKDSYTINSERYGYTHTFEKSYGANNYMLKTQESWMPMSVILDPASKNVVAVDPDGGPFLTEGWSNDEIVIKDIYQIGTVIMFSLDEK